MFITATHINNHILLYDTIQASGLTWRFTKHETEEDDKDDDEEESKQPPEPIYTSDQKSNQLMRKSNESIVSV